MVRPWTIRAWPQVAWRVVCGERPSLRHMDTQILPMDRGFQRFNGQTIWAGDLAGCEVAIAWDWTQISRGVVALSDPMSIVSNLCLVDREGCALQDWQAAVHLNTLVRDLPWQATVRRTLRAGMALPAAA